MSAGTDIAAEIAAALAEAGESVGDGPLYCTIEKGIVAGETPRDGAEFGSMFEVTAVQSIRVEKDGVGSVQKRVRELAITATGSAVEKGDRVSIGVRLSDVVSGTTKFERIAEVDVLAPGGIPLLYTADLEG